MDTEVQIIFTGICHFLTDKNRVIIGATPGRTNCNGTKPIPTHSPYVTYLTGQRQSGKSPRKSNGSQEAVAIGGLVTITGNITETRVTYPGTTPPLPYVVVTKDIAPAYTPLPSATADDITTIDPRVVSARIDLPNGDFLPPIPTNEIWHFFPQKSTHPISMHIAQAVTLKLHVTDGLITISEQPFSAGSTPSEVVTLKGSPTNPIIIIAGNSSDPDIVPINPQTRPAIGPDFDFELHWNVFDLNGDTDCPPASYNEGPPIGADGSFFLTLGGGNCPPTQWP